MSDIPQALKLLDKLLAGLPDDIEPMLASELDGFLTGIIVSPDMIMPGEWLTMVWGGDDEDASPAFEDIDEANKVIGLIMEHYNSIISDLNGGCYAPVFDIDTRHDEILWEIWIDGFGAAMALRPDSWLALAESSDEEVRFAISGLSALGTISQGECDLPESQIEDLTNLAPELIPIWVESLHVWRLENVSAPPPQQRRSIKVGRNDPCPCGSGRKYKKCCGLN